jgi:hypothetical protein
MRKIGCQCLTKPWQRWMGRAHQAEQEVHMVLGYSGHATNSAMELRAAIEMPTLIPEVMHVWI